MAPLDRWIEDVEAAISEAAKRGFALFNGKANCLVCHSGWRLQLPRHRRRTKDPGRGRADDVLMQFAFKTPTLRSVAVRPPRRSWTLSGSTRRAAVERPSRPPLIVPLELTEQERTDLLAMETLTGEEGGAAAR